MQKLIVTTLAAAALATVPSVSAAKERLAPEAELSKMLDGRVAGEPRNCINLSTARSSRIIDGTAIVYRVGSTLWVNRPHGAESLDDDDILVTRLHGSQLCSIDTVQLHDRSSQFYRGFVSLGEFVPYRRVAQN